QTKQHVTVDSGLSLKDAAVDNSIPGIGENCGGSCACGTCHVYVAPEWIHKMEEAGEDELDVLDAADNVKDNSRLSCQVLINDDMDGLQIQVPPHSA
ncbi:MAG: 2Fe-2S iron-sulfur cluster binding domain-containing protein, partial [Magnetovibrio sp.]|nr:2Fe-2S iron-sulfur cluster binding domain-containing protein [Magnetovibrio sp.]